MKNFLTSIVSALLLSGCWTFNETDYPVANASKAPAGKDISVMVKGYDAVLTDYLFVSTYQTVYVPGYCGYRHYYTGHYETVPTTIGVPQVRNTDAFLRRAREAMEQGGYVIGATTPDWTMEVEFEGPSVSSNDQIKQAAWMLCSCFFCDYAAATWYAKLRIRDNRTGRLAYHREYEQRYETNVFGLIPLFGISGCKQSTYSYIQGWCLAALTDRTVSDATAFLNSGK